MKKLSTILNPTVLKEDAENACEDAMSCLNEIITMCNNLIEGLQDVDSEMDESMMECISSTREHIKSACDCALEAYGFDACCDTCKDDEEAEVEEEKESDEDQGISKDDETKFHKKLDDLVHSTFGKRMDEAISQKVKIGSLVKGVMGVYGRSSGTVVRFGSDQGKKIVYVKSKDGKEWNTPEYNIRVVDSLDEAKTITEPEEAGLNDYVMPKSVIKMIAKQQFNRVKAGTKLFDAVSKVDKTKDLLHLFTSKKHKNILIGMVMIGEKSSFFIHDTDAAKTNKLDNVGRFKDTKSFTDTLSSLFEKKKEDGVKKK